MWLSHMQLNITHPEVKIHQFHTSAVKHNYGLEILMISFGICLYWILQDACKDGHIHSDSLSKN